MRVLDEETMDRVAEYNIRYPREHGRSPSFRNVMHALGLGSLATVQRYVRALERRGSLELEKDGSIQPLPSLLSGESTIVPLVGEIACGEPNYGVENIEESFALPKALFGDGDLFMLRTFGNSMTDAGINKGDLIVLRRQDTADDGEIVVALVDGNTTLKRLYHRDGKIVLHPENKRMKDIIVDECAVQGVLVGCIKTYG